MFQEGSQVAPLSLIQTDNLLVTEPSANPSQTLSEAKVQAQSAVIAKNPLWFTELHRIAEIKMASQPAISETPLSELDAERLFHELQVLQIELEMQNEELELWATAEKSDAKSHLDHTTALYRKQKPPVFEKELSILREQITRREMSILLLVGHGSTSREIAEQLGISIKTVEIHRARMMKKLKTKNVAALARWAFIAELMTVAG